MIQDGVLDGFWCRNRPKNRYISVILAGCDLYFDLSFSAPADAIRFSRCPRGFGRPTPIRPPITQSLLPGGWDAWGKIQDNAPAANHAPHHSLPNGMLLAYFAYLLQKGSGHLPPDSLRDSLGDLNNEGAARLQRNARRHHDDAERQQLTPPFPRQHGFVILSFEGGLFILSNE
jgi:hypothetical protein